MLARVPEAARAWRRLRGPGGWQGFLRLAMVWRRLGRVPEAGEGLEEAGKGLGKAGEGLENAGEGLEEVRR
jgi:hypothetical protein